MPSYYEVLQLKPASSGDEVDASYRWACKAVAGKPDDALRRAAIDEAYETLRDPERRRTYDVELEAGTAPTTARNGVPLVSADEAVGAVFGGCHECGAVPAGDYPIVRASGSLITRFQSTRAMTANDSKSVTSIYREHHRTLADDFPYANVRLRDPKRARAQGFGAGRYCRQHGRSAALAAVRHNLVFGWWGFTGLVLNIPVIALDLVSALRYGRLAAERS